MEHRDPIHPGEVELEAAFAEGPGVAGVVGAAGDDGGASQRHEEGEAGKDRYRFGNPGSPSAGGIAETAAAIRQPTISIAIAMSARSSPPARSRTTHQSTEQALDDDGRQRGGGEPGDAAPGPAVERPGQHHGGDDQQAGERAHRPVEVLDDGVHLQGRQRTALSEGPVVLAAETRTGDPHDAAQRNLEIGADGRSRGHPYEGAPRQACPHL